MHTGDVMAASTLCLMTSWRSTLCDYVWWCYVSAHCVWCCCDAYRWCNGSKHTVSDDVMTQHTMCDGAVFQHTVSDAAVMHTGDAMAASTLCWWCRDADTMCDGAMFQHTVSDAAAMHTGDVMAASTLCLMMSWCSTLIVLCFSTLCLMLLWCSTASLMALQYGTHLRMLRAWLAPASFSAAPLGLAVMRALWNYQHSQCEIEMKVKALKWRYI